MLVAFHLLFRMIEIIVAFTFLYQIYLKLSLSLIVYRRFAFKMSLKTLTFNSPLLDVNFR